MEFTLAKPEDLPLSGSRENWEEAVFLNVDHFRVHRFLANGQQESVTVEDFEEALSIAGHEMRRGRRVLIYAALR